MVKYSALLIVFLLVLNSCGNDSEDILIKEVWIPMSDGIKLAADLYIPSGEFSNITYPILLEYLPYRKDEHRKLRFPVFSYFVNRGYIVARVDIRGTGRSEGALVEYEYSEQEKEDGKEVIAWLAKQPFSTGSIGMFGISWGGFNAIQLAMRQPPALKAILVMMATDDIYEDDVHFIDGMMHVDAYEIGRDLKNVIPGAPDYLVDESYFKNKFDTEPWLLKYKRQQRDGPFWNVSSLNSDYGSLQVPVFMISGWYDGYRDSSPRILQNIGAPKKAIVGPWNHTFPHMANPPPSIEWREEAVRWFDYWLKGEENGIMKEPELAVFIRAGHGPGVLDSIGGHWQSFEGWPINNTVKKTFYLHPNSLLDTAQAIAGTLDLEYIPSSGIEASGSVMWWGDWSSDQSNTDAHCLVFDSEPLKEDVVILGFPRFHFNASVSSSQTHFIARLNDVSTDNSVTLVTGAGLNGSHRYSSENPEYIIPGKAYPLEIEMHFTSWTFKKGHRIRLSLSNGQWPMVWPNPSLLSLTLIVGGNDPSSLLLPRIINSTESHPEFKKPGADPSLKGYKTTKFGTVSGFAEVSETQYDPDTKTTKVIANNTGEIVYPWAKWTTKENIVHKVTDLSPETASVSSEYSIQIETEKQNLTWTGILDFSSDKSFFYYDYTRKLFGGKKLIRSKTWRDTIIRDFQ